MNVSRAIEKQLSGVAHTEPELGTETYLSVGSEGVYK